MSRLSDEWCCMNCIHQEECSVKERLPDENEDIIILCKHGAIFNGTYSNNVWFCMDGYIHDTYKGNPIYSSMSSIPSSWEPIAWMPIPKFEE